MPRGGTFPVKKAFKSRWEGGKVMEADFAQLEFRVAAFLAQDELAMEEVRTGFDVHSYTAKVITDAGEDTTRQNAKAHCVTTDTEALTKDGWKKYHELAVGDMLLTYNQSKDETEWKPILELSHFSDEEVWTYGHANWKVTTTPNHRWYGTYKGVVTIFTAEGITPEHTITSCPIFTSRVPTYCKDFEITAKAKADVWCPRTENGTWVMRQGKVVTITGNTFAPLYGATGHGRTAAQAAYYHHFIEKYVGIAAWHKKLGDEAVRFEKITIPSGRQYAFPNTVRRKNGSVTNFTRIKNYPVQGFATGDIVPVVLIEIDRRLREGNFKSLLVNTVHDSIVFDVHPDEIDAMIALIDGMNTDLHDIIKNAFGIDMNVPLLLEAKIGDNWLNQKDVKKL